MARKRFLDGTLRLDDLSEVTGLRITQVATGTGRAFRVIALPGEEIVYWSFWRGKVNRFAIKQAEELKVPVDFESHLYGQSLKFKYRYEPSEYIVGGLFCMATAGFLQADMDSSNAMVGLFSGLGLFQFVQAYRAKTALKNL
jgi:elongation factor Tu